MISGSGIIRFADVLAQMYWALNGWRDSSIQYMLDFIPESKNIPPIGQTVRLDPSEAFL